MFSHWYVIFQESFFINLFLALAISLAWMKTFAYFLLLPIMASLLGHKWLIPEHPIYDIQEVWNLRENLIIIGFVCVR